MVYHGFDSRMPRQSLMEETLITEAFMEFLYEQFGEPDLDSVSDEMKEAWMRFFAKRDNTVL